MGARNIYPIVSYRINWSKNAMKYKTPECKDDMSFHDCELAILRAAIDQNGEKIRQKNVIKNQSIKDIIKILEDFLIRKKLVCYGGTAINNILPKHAQFYDYTKEIPDYDFYSPNALEDAIELADIYHKRGFKEVEAKAGVHYGTFKVYVEFTAIADITLMQKDLFKNIQASAKHVAGILYSPPDFLRMNMYLELSRPLGDITRWEKVFKRLTLLNEYYPLRTDIKCNAIDFQRHMGKDGSVSTNSDAASVDQEIDKSQVFKQDQEEDAPESDQEPESNKAPRKNGIQERIYTVLRDAFIDENVVFFGGYATSLYGKYMPPKQRKRVLKVPDFEVLTEDPERVCTIVKERFEDEGIRGIIIEKRDPIGEIIPVHYEIRIGQDILAHVYEPLACHSYNELELGPHTKIRVGTIDTLLTFYLSFIYVNKPYYYTDRILCMAKFLFDVQQQNRLKQVGILRRFTTNCIGNQPSLEDILAKKREKFKELKDKRGTKEYNMWFLKYSPGGETGPDAAPAAAPVGTKKRPVTKKKRTKRHNNTVKIGF
jgi:hypothetical protein